MRIVPLLTFGKVEGWKACLLSLASAAVMVSVLAATAPATSGPLAPDYPADCLTPAWHDGAAYEISLTAYYNCLWDLDFDTVVWGLYGGSVTLTCGPDTRSQCEFGSTPGCDMDTGFEVTLYDGETFVRFDSWGPEEVHPHGSC